MSKQMTRRVVTGAIGLLLWVAASTSTFANDRTQPSYYQGNPNLATYQHRRWMEPRARALVMRHYVQRANLARINMGAWKQLVREFPLLRKVHPRNIRIAKAGDPVLKAMLAQMGKDIPLLGASVFTYDGHPYVWAHQTGQGGSNNNTFVWDTTTGRFHDGSKIKSHPIDHVSTNKDKLAFLWAAPGDVARSVGDELQFWKNDPTNPVHCQGWACTHFLTTTLRRAGDQLRDDAHNPFKDVWGVPSWLASRSSDVGMRSVLTKASSPPDLVLLTLRPERYDALMGGNTRRSPKVIPELQVPKQYKGEER